MFAKLFSKFAGKKTYTAAVLMVLHQVLKFLGIDVADQNLSITIDTVLAILTAIFRMMAKPKEQKPE